MEVSFQWKNPDFLIRNPDFLLKNPDFLLKNVDLIIKQYGDEMFFIEDGEVDVYRTVLVRRSGAEDRSQGMTTGAPSVASSVDGDSIASSVRACLTLCALLGVATVLILCLRPLLNLLPL